MPTTALPATATVAREQNRARMIGKAQQNAQNMGENILEVQDARGQDGYVIYVYNIVDLPHPVRQTGFYLNIPACPKGQKVAWTTLPAWTRDIYVKPGSTEYMYKMIDGRKAATSLLNPAAYPSKDWDTQLANWQADDQQGNNLNAYGCWWSLTMPEETDKLDREIALFKKRVLDTMNGLVAQAELFYAAGDRKSITPLMHFAMDYLKKKAEWHMSMQHMISCPNCGEDIVDGIAYHKNDFGEKCIVDVERYEKMLAAQKRVTRAAPAPEVAEDDEEIEEAPAAPKAKVKRTKAT